MKQFCSIHRFYYNGNTCPFCEKDRIDNLANRYGNKSVVTKKTNSGRVITESDIEKLKNKFNKK